MTTSKDWSIHAYVSFDLRSLVLGSCHSAQLFTIILLRCEDTASDAESVTSKKKTKPTSTKGGDNENDSMNESDDEKDLFSSHNASPASIASNKETLPSTASDGMSNSKFTHKYSH